MFDRCHEKSNINSSDGSSTLTQELKLNTKNPVEVVELSIKYL